MITQSILKELVHYNPYTGVFTWLPRPIVKGKKEWCISSWNTKYSGKVAGSVNGRGYRDLRVLKKIIKEHRLAWLYVYGNFPEFGIDHIDGNTSNNRISNLRDVSQAENNKNAKKRNDNSSGISGVSFDKASNKWRAYIAGKSIGRYSEIDDAIQARKNAESDLRFHENHGRADALLIAKFGR